MLNYFKQKALQKRLDHYHLQLGLIGGDIHNLNETPKRLAKFWQQIKPEDFLNTPPAKRINMKLEVRSGRLVSLVTFLSEFNTLAAAESEFAIETLAKTALGDVRRVSFEHYLCDEKLYAIDVVKTLRTLRSELLQHVHILENSENQYYQRVAHNLYIELFNVTASWLGLMSNREITLIKP